MNPVEVADLAQAILESHHRYLHAELPRLEALLKNGNAQIRAPFTHLRRVMDAHMAMEEKVVFPAILSLAADGDTGGDDLAKGIEQIRAEHDEIATLEDSLRNAARDAGDLEDAILALLDDLVIHHQKEDESLFPAALALLAAPPPKAKAPKKGAKKDKKAEPPAAEEALAMSPGPAADAPRKVVRRTTGVCPACHAHVPAAVVEAEGKVWLEKDCAQHGKSAQLLSVRPEYWAELDKFYFQINEQEYPQRDYIVRMTERCNLACPICLAKANTEDTPDFDLKGLENLLSERRGIKIDLMAAEPTLRPDIEDWIRKVKATGNIAALHTNGLKLANKEFAQRIKDAGVDEVFLQFDGMDEEANKALRGRPLLKARMAALANMRELGIATSLIVVIGRNLNEPQVGEVFRMALQPENDHIREVFFLGLRLMGSARYAGSFTDQQIMPDELIDQLCAQESAITRRDVHDFNKFYFTMLSAFQVRKCLYVQHYMVARDGRGGFTPMSEIVDLPALSRAADKYAARFHDHPTLARAGFSAAVIRQGLRPPALRIAKDLLRMERLFQVGMNLKDVPNRFLILGFITACDPYNYDAQVAINCGKGELSADGGYTESSAVANVAREARFDETGRDPGRAFGEKTT